MVQEFIDCAKRVVLIPLQRGRGLRAPGWMPARRGNPGSLNPPTAGKGAPSKEWTMSLTVGQTS